MTRTAARPRSAPVQPESFLDCFRYFLTPQLWKQVVSALRPGKASRWQAQPLLFILLTVTWCAGDSVPERFETARAFYVACYQKRRRPGKTCEGFQKALARVPCRALRLVAAALRARLQQIFASRWVVDGFIPFGCDGSRVQCPRSEELETRLPASSTGEAPPQVWVTALVHLSLGLLWSWRLGRGTADERLHLRHLVATLPRGALLVADAGYAGYELLRALAAAGLTFLIRLSSKAPLYVPDKKSLHHYCEGLVYYWPQWAQAKELPPVPVRLLRIHGRKVDVWLITNVLQAERLPRKSASQFYRWRWRNEGLFRTYKRTLGKVKLMSRTVTLVHREMEGSLLAVQLLLAQGTLAVQRGGPTVIVLPSARKVLLEIRAEIRNVTGMYLGPRQQQTYWQRLQRARGDERHRRREEKVRRPWPGRVPHKPPGKPKILKMGTDLKKLMAKTLGQT
jgi:Transposase DDE domain